MASCSVTRLLVGPIIALTLSSVASAFTFPTSIPNGLQAAGTGTASTNGSGPSSSSDPENSGILTAQFLATTSLNASVGGPPAGSISSTLTAKYGNLTMSANANVASFIQGTNFFSSSGSLGQLNSLPNAAYQDTLTLTSATLPAGSPVSIRFTNTTAGHVATSPTTFDSMNITSSFQATDQPAGGGSILEPELLYTTTIGTTQNANDTRSQILNLSIGDTLIIGGYLNTTYGAGTGAGSATGSASQSLQLDILTPGAAYTSASSTQYAIAAPEPASLTFLAAALPLLTRTKRRN